MSLFSAAVTTSCFVLRTIPIDAVGLDKYTARGVFSLCSPLMDLLLIAIDLPRGDHKPRYCCLQRSASFVLSIQLTLLYTIYRVGRPKAGPFSTVYNSCIWLSIIHQHFQYFIWSENDLLKFIFLKYLAIDKRYRAYTQNNDSPFTGRCH